MIKVDITIDSEYHWQKRNPVILKWNSSSMSKVQVLSSHKKKEAGIIEVEELKRARLILVDAKNRCPENK